MMSEKRVYVLESQIGTIKVGCSRWPEQRAELVCSHSPCPVRLVAILAGGHAIELAIHQKLSACLSHNEWFKVEGEAARFLGSVFGEGVAIVRPWGAFSPTSRAERLADSNARKAAAAKARWADPEYRARIKAYRETRLRLQAVRVAREAA